MRITESPFDCVVRRFSSRMDWRVKYRFGFYQYGSTRVFRIAKLCIHLWSVK